MPRTSSSGRGPSIETLTATIHLHGQNFTFKLFSRPLVLGDSVTVQYYWLDSRMFRQITQDASADNFQNCVGHWAASLRSMGIGDDLDQQIHYVMALCYPLVSNRKSLQDVYRDAYLAPGRINAAGPLPKAVRRRVQDIAASQDRLQVQAELDHVLGRFTPPGRVLPLLREAFRHWVGKGVALLRSEGNAGLEQYLEEVDYWLGKYRKRSGCWVRHFINMFAYEAKVSFYRCFANIWVDLIPWLREHRGLDEASERFLRFWHHQNQPLEIPHGQTLGGIHYPTHGRATVSAKRRGKQPVSESLTWVTPRIGPPHVQDVFSGQVLSLHPLSAFFMKDPKACAAAGSFLTSGAYEDVMTRGKGGA